MIANENMLINSQKQLSAKLMQAARQLTPNRLRMKRHLSISEQSVYDPSIIDDDNALNGYKSRLTNELLRNVKTSNLVHIFIHKLKQNAGIVHQKPYKKGKKIQKAFMRNVFEILYHFSIAYYYLGICCLLLLSSWNATLPAFRETMSLNNNVFALKMISFFAIVIQIIINIWSYFFHQGQRIDCSSQNLRKNLFTFNSQIKVIQIILGILFLAIPESAAVSGIFFVILASTLIFGVYEASHLQAAYIHTKTRSFRWRIARIFFLNILMIHNVATVLISMIMINQQHNWFIQYDLMDVPWNEQYIAAYYWSTIILTTIGFGDFCATNPEERIIVSFLALFSCALLAFNINTFSNIFGMLKQNIDNVESQVVMFRRMVRRDYKNNVGIHADLKRSIYEYIDSLLEQRKQLEYIQKNQFLGILPQNLRKKYYKETNKCLFSEVVFLSSLRNQTLSALTEKFSVIFMKQNQTFQPNAYQIRILQQGSIDFTYSRPESTTSYGNVYDNLTVRKRENVVLINSDFLTLENQSNFNLKVKQYSVTWFMTTQNFLNVLKKDVVDFQFYFNILHRHSYNNNEWGSFDCPRCYLEHKKFKHTAFKCPSLTYIPLRTFKLYKKFASPQIDQMRVAFKRKKDAAPRTSVLKYWKKYLKKNFQLERKRDEQSHIKNIVRVPKKFSVFELFIKRTYKSYHSYYTGKDKYEVLESQQYLEIQVDTPFNFEFYMVDWNPRKFIFKEVDKCGNLGQSSYLGTLKNIQYMMGHKFDYEEIQEVGR